jgi:hypothetical protein
MQAERVVELRFTTGPEPKSGSGYMISARHVLTARHVVSPEEVGAPCTIEPLLAPGSANLPIAAQPKPAPVPGRAGWLSTDADLAVVQLDNGPIAQIASEPISFGKLPLDDLRPRIFWCTGFPLAAGTASRTIDGQFTYEPKNKRFDFDTASEPRKWQEWAGLSGALAFCGDSAVAVVRRVQPGFERSLTATPIQFLLDDAAFLNYWRRENMPPLRAVEILRSEYTLLERISSFAYLIDRVNAVSEVKRYIKPPGSGRKPQVIAIVGLDDDEHTDVVQQLSEDPEVQRILGREAKSEDVIVPLPWPNQTRRIDPEECYREFVRRLSAAANIAPKQGQLPRPEELRESFEQGSTPRAFFTLVRRRIAFGGHAALLRRVLDLWDSLGTGLPVLLFLCLAWDEPAARAPGPLNFMFSAAKPEAELVDELRNAYARFGDRLYSIELEPITDGHVPPWIDLLRIRCQSVRQAQLDGFKLVLMGRIGTGLPARAVAKEIGVILQQM